MQCILQWKIKHNKIDKGGEGEEGGFKPQAIMFWKVKLASCECTFSKHFAHNNYFWALTSGFLVLCNWKPCK